MNNKKAIFAILAIIVIVIVVFVIAVKFLPQKEHNDGITGYQTPSVFDITGFFTNTIKNTVETIQNIGKDIQETQEQKDPTKLSDAFTNPLDKGYYETMSLHFT